MVWKPKLLLVGINFLLETSFFTVDRPSPKGQNWSHFSTKWACSSSIDVFGYEQVDLDNRGGLVGIGANPCHFLCQWSSPLWRLAEWRHDPEWDLHEEGNHARRDCLRDAGSVSTHWARVLLPNLCHQICQGKGRQRGTTRETTADVE